MKPKLVLSGIISTSAIALILVLGSVSSVQACSLSEFESYQETTSEQPDWLRSPWAVLLTLPGIALATGLSLGGRYYRE